MWKYIKRFLQLLLILVIVFVLVCLIYLFIQDVNSTKAREYAMKEYDLKKKSYFITKDKKKFYVIEYEDGTYESNFND